MEQAPALTRMQEEHVYEEAPATARKADEKAPATAWTADEEAPATAREVDEEADAEVAAE